MHEQEQVILNVFCEYTSDMFDIVLPTKRIKFHHGFFWIKLWNFKHFLMKYQMFCWFQRFKHKNKPKNDQMLYIT